MSKYPFVSIIIPVFNVGPYIEDCIQSVMVQDYKGRLECILIDDCGIDDSIEIARKVINTNNGHVQFRIIQHDRNLGLSAARNTGLRVAQGEFCYMLDSDDEISFDCISSLVSPLLNRSYDMVIGEYIVTGVEDRFDHLKWKEGAYWGHKEICEGYYSKKWFQIAVNKLYNMNFLRQHRMLFLEGVIHEDELWSAELACLLESVYVVNKPSYKYKVRASSITTANNYLKRKESYYKMIQSFSDFIERRGLLEDEYSLRIFIKFISLFYAISQREGSFEGKQCYIDIRSLISFPSKSLCYSRKGLNKKIIHLHYCLPPHLGYYVKRLIEFIVKVKSVLKL